jgi:Ca-activated chloride channel family protein
MREACILLLAAAFARGQNDVTFRASVNLVHVDAEVLAADGRILTGLAKSDFRVFDEGKEQPIVQFASEEEPLDLILLFDVSGSMRAVVQSVAEAAREGLEELRPGDRVAVMVFNTHSRMIARFTEDLDAVERTIREDVVGTPFGGGTFIQEAVDDAALTFMHEKRTHHRRAVLIITDNIGTRTRREMTVVRDFWEADAILTGLIVSNPTFEKVHTVARILGPQTIFLEAGMKGIAQKTGGDFIRSAEPGPAFRDAMHRIRSRYGLYYELPKSKAGTRRRVRVELSAEAAKRFPKSRVHSRTGYMVPVTETPEIQAPASPSTPARIRPIP